MLLYNSYLLVISYCVEVFLRKAIGNYFELKGQYIGNPSFYLGVHMNEVEFETGVKAWDFVSTQYDKVTTKNLSLSNWSLCPPYLTHSWVVVL